MFDINILYLIMRILFLNDFFVGYTYIDWLANDYHISFSITYKLLGRSTSLHYIRKFLIDEQRTVGKMGKEKLKLVKVSIYIYI